MKKEKKLLKCMLIVFCSVLILLNCTSVMAAKSKIPTLKANKWQSVKMSQKYKIVIPKDSVVTFYATLASKAKWSWNDNYNYYGIFNTSNENVFAYRFTKENIARCKKGTGYKFALDKGTYYFSAAAFIKIKYKVTPLKLSAKNYCMAKAKTLASGKKVTMIQSNSTSHCVWYKIKLQKQKRIDFKCIMPDVDHTAGAYPLNMGDLNLYNASGDEVSLQKNARGYNSSDAVPAGIYYICCTPVIGPEVTMSWS